jgi:hypothetical protein
MVGADWLVSALARLCQPRYTPDWLRFALRRRCFASVPERPCLRSLFSASDCQSLGFRFRKLQWLAALTQIINARLPLLVAKRLTLRFRSADLAGQPVAELTIQSDTIAIEFSRVFSCAISPA